LGRGLKALLEDTPVRRVEEEASLTEVNLDAISPNRYQPRKDFDKEALKELAESIRTTGVLQPIMVRRIETGYEIVAGERRWRAAKLAGLKAIPVVVREVNDTEMLTIALVENIQRENLNPIEEAEAYRQLLDQFETTQEELAVAIGKSRSAVANTLRLLELPESVKQAVAEGKLSAGHARAILAIEGEAARIDAARTVMEKGLSVRETERLAKRLQRKAATAKTRLQRAERKRDPFLLSIEEEMQQRLATRVHIKPKGLNKGTIEIEYYSIEDLERIIEKLSGGQAI